MTQAILHGNDSASGPKLYVAFELSAKSWKIALGPGDKRYREVTVDAGDLAGVERATAMAKEWFGHAADGPILSCYEAGRDGFWLHRALEARGWANVVVDAASMDVDRRARRVKTDRIDMRRLLSTLVRYDRGEKDVWSVLRIPSVEDEDARRLHRELGRLKKERTMHVSRIRSLLVLHGAHAKFSARFVDELRAAKTPDGHGLPLAVTEEIMREHERLQLVRDQIKALEEQRKAAVVEAKATVDAKATAAKGTPTAAKGTPTKVHALLRLRAIGVNGAWLLVHELFGWRTFSNRRQLAGCAGLTPTPYQSGESDRQQGISKAGNPRVRAMLVELAWCWLRYQPRSALTRWFQEKFGHGNGRMKRIGIVALTRRLLIALWRYLEEGLVPDGALLKPDGTLMKHV
jgi:transposase